MYPYKRKAKEDFYNTQRRRQENGAEKDFKTLALNIGVTQR